jgi:[citrate (pro-3S)-lyase] ligase
MNEMGIWHDLYAKGGSLAPFFREHNISSIAIYGCGLLGDRMYDAALSCGVAAEYGIDLAVKEFCDIPVYHPSGLKDINIHVDMIVVCVSDWNELVHGFEIVTYLQDVICPKIHLIDILNICFFKQIIIPYCVSLSAAPYILSLPLHRQLHERNAFEMAVSEIIYGNIALFAHNPSYFSEIYAAVPEYGDEYIRNVFSASPVSKRNRTLFHSDMCSPYVNIIQGIRFTHGVPEMFDTAVHIVGDCITFGVGLDDSRTVASCLQGKLNTLGIANVGVVNHGAWGMESNNSSELYNKLHMVRMKPGDIVVFLICSFNLNSAFYFAHNLNDERKTFFSLLDCFNEQRDGSLYFDHIHLSHRGTERIAHYFCNTLVHDGVVNPNIKTPCTDASGSSATSLIAKTSDMFRLESHKGELAIYVSRLKMRRCYDSIAGAVVMNCNPFTLGHRHLIETAAKLTDVLYVFIVEEDKSTFSFKDRLHLVKAGTKDIENVVVLPSGKFILSSLTLPEYFLKDTLNEAVIDASTDVLTFARHIAPALCITKRFVGQEPTDAITRQYNQTLKAMLPGYSIEVIEIPRLALTEDKEQIISASVVRRLMKEENWSELRKYVPESTYSQLIAMAAE